MLSDHELRRCLYVLEAFNVERTESATNTDKLGEAICAFANDLPDSREAGVLFVGAKDDGACAGLEITERVAQTLIGTPTAGAVVVR